MSLGKAHYVLKSLIDVGWVKLNNFRGSNNKLGYAYVLTPDGIAEKAAITVRFLARKQREYIELQAEIEASAKLRCEQKKRLIVRGGIMIKPIKKAVIPVAGLGTRMLPATKAIPKELLPVYDRPIIEHVVKEAIAAGITEIILVTRSGKEAIENHFDAHYELEHRLEKKGKETILGTVKNIIPTVMYGDLCSTK